MFNQMYKWWWKLLGAGLVIFSIIAGLAIPVGPGVQKISPSRAPEGSSAEISVTGYNSNFKDAAASTQVFLRKDSIFFCAVNVTVFDNTNLNATFNIPTGLPNYLTNTFYDVVVNNDKDGTYSMRDAFFIESAPLATDEPVLNSDISVIGCIPDINVNAAQYLSFPYRVVLYETIRNLYFHVPMWFGMTFLLLVSFIASIMYLNKMTSKFDILASQAVHVAILFGLLGFTTGALWGHYTWGNLDSWLIRDAKVLGAMIGILMYFAYFILRGSLDDEEKKAKISAVYNIFAFSMYIIFIYVMPRMTATLHPGSGGNPAFNIYDVDSNMRPVFYSAVIGWILIGLWIASIRVRYKLLKLKSDDNSINNTIS